MLCTHTLTAYQLNRNVTIQARRLVVTEVQSESFGLVTEHRHDMRLLCAVSHKFAYWTFAVSVFLIFFIVECGIAHFLCAVHCAHAMRVFGIILTT